METTYTSVQDYYGEVLNSNKDLQTSACCPTEPMPAHLRHILSEIHPEIVEKFYGCGSPIPLELKGKIVLDLGSGTGRDCFIMSKLVGESGKVIGIDMTENQISLALKYCDFHHKKFGFENTSFLKGYIENLKELGIADNSMDIVTSNCVINLSPNKKDVFKEIFRVLKPGGELYFSDIFCSRRLPDELKEDKVLLGECLGGAIYVEDFRRMLLELGIKDYRVVSNSKISLFNEKIKDKVGSAEFYSITIRAFKLDLEDRCEDYGQVAIYNGTMEHSPNGFLLDDHHFFETNRPALVCSNTARMLSKTRFSSHFKIIGEEKTHFGIFNCDPNTQFKDSKSPGACC